MSPIRYPADLPITPRREEIVAAIRNHQVVILAGETGSGKTTQLPKMCLEALPDARGMIGCTQPRRVAAMSVSKRVAEELNVTWGREVGCKMRFSDDTSRETRVKFMTDGILLAEIQSDPMLRAYSIIILDEAHERSLNIDFLLGHLVGLLPRRPDLKLLVTSATIDTGAFAEAFGGAPIIEVSGRLYPVDIRYAPDADDDDGHFIDAAVAAVENVLIETDDGDVLVFMPTERDIRDTRDILEGRLGRGFEVLSLFGRMPGAEQQRIFSPGRLRRVIIATNVAETSITIPRIRCVVDTGLARMSRYNAQKRTKRLPVEAVSQSSANQRAGRAGRVQDGVCIRLYSQEDFEKRDRFTTPEIQRSNLAEVILRLKAFRLGDIETFPFLNPPASSSIRAGYQLLHELGALDDTHDMTPLGRELARLPLDPSLGRMLLQARRENALPELLVIAAGLSIPDPRERPEDKRDQAQAAHKGFVSPQSDFLTLLRIWQAAPPPTGGSRQGLRRFCKSYFLSYTRMQEWRDVWKQLCDSFSDDLRAAGPPAGDDAIHRCILAAHLGHIAMKEGRNLYKAGGNREVAVFPGSALYERREKRSPGGPAAEKSRQPAWIVAGEMVHTSQLFARSIARIDPEWIVELGAHLCEVRYSDPQWNAKAGRVLVTQRTLLHGLEVKRQSIDYLKIDAVGATHMFIRAALIDSEDSPVTHRFRIQNNALRHRVETILSRGRRARVDAVEERLFLFYDVRLKNISSVHDLNRLIRAQPGGRDDFLCAGEADLIESDDVECDPGLFPNQVSFGSSVLPLSYAYTPGAERDGVTVRVPASVAGHLSSGQVQWMIPGLREELAAVMLRALPKPLRRQLMPIEAKARDIAQSFDPGRGDFHAALAEFISRRYRVQVRAADWPPHSLPVHLQPRLEVVDPRNKEVIVAGRDLNAIRATVEKQDVRSDAWEQLARRVERFALCTWSFGDLPEKVLVEEVGGASVYGWPGLVVGDEGIEVRLFRSAEEAARGTPRAIRQLAETELAKEMTWLSRELRSFGSTVAKPRPAVSLQDALSRVAVVAATPTGTGGEPAREHILAHLLRLDPPFPLAASRFEALCASVRRELPGVTHRVTTLCRQILDQRTALLALPKRYPGMEADLARLIPETFPATVPHSQLPHLLRYLKAMKVRQERWVVSPAKDADKAALVAQFADWPTRVPAANHETFRWMLEEFRVQVFAQELGTAQPVSAKRLEAMTNPAVR